MLYKACMESYLCKGVIKKGEIYIASKNVVCQHHKKSRENPLQNCWNNVSFKRKNPWLKARMQYKFDSNPKWHAPSKKEHFIGGTDRIQMNIAFGALTIRSTILLDLKSILTKWQRDSPLGVGISRKSIPWENLFCHLVGIDV